MKSFNAIAEWHNLKEARVLIRMWWNNEWPESITGNKDEVSTSNPKVQNKYLFITRKGFWEFPGERSDYTLGKEGERCFKKKTRNVYDRAWHRVDSHWLFVNWINEDRWICEFRWLRKMWKG